MRFILILILLICKFSFSQRPGTDDLLNKFPHDTIYWYLPVYENQENRVKYPVRLSKKNNYFDGIRNFYRVSDSMVGSHLLGFVKSKYMNFDMKVPDMKLIDTTWINKNQDKILYPEVFENYQFIEILSFLGSKKALYIIEEENFFGDKVYAREAKIFTDYSYEE